MADLSRREAAQAHESENYEFRKGKVKVSAKIGTEKGVEQYTHL